MRKLHAAVGEGVDTIQQTEPRPAPKMHRLSRLRNSLFNQGLASNLFHIRPVLTDL